MFDACRISCVVLALAASEAGIAQAKFDPDKDVDFSADSSIFPDSWLREEIQSSGDPISDRNRDRALSLVQRALAKYPNAILDRNLSKVYVLGKLRFSGITASGTTSRRNVYVALGDRRRGFTDLWFERVFHSEFSSILLRNFPESIDEDRWKATNPDGFRYGQSGVDAVKQRQTGRLFHPSELQDGFIGRYARSTFENDFNAVAGQLFLGEPKLWRAAEKHESIRIKLELTVGFYQSLDDSLNQEFFRSLVELN